MEQPNKHPKVSVIIPIYNTCHYVQEALESICRQTLTELEIIAIDDGSTDSSRKVVEQVAATDMRIRVYSQANQGQSITRNNGMQYVQGKYVYFMDSDDRLEADTLETCYSACEAGQLDFVCFDADILNKDHPCARHFNYDRSACARPKQVYKGVELLQRQLSARVFSPSPCLNLISTSYLKTSGLNFYPRIIHEDQLFTSQLYLKAEKGRIHSPEILFATLQNRLHHDPAVHLEKHGGLSHRDRRATESGSLLSGKRPQADTSVLMSDARRSRMASPHIAPTPTHRAFPTLPEILQALRQDAYPDGTDAEKKGGGEMKSGKVRYGLIQINVGFTTDHADL